MPGILEDQDPVTRIVKSEAHKLNHEFIATSAIKKSQPVKLTAATGKIAPLAAGDVEHLMIGVALHDAAADEYVTVTTRGYMILKAEATAANQNAGPVELGTYDTDPGIVRITASSAQTKTIGWQLEPTTAIDEETIFLVKD